MAYYRGARVRVGNHSGNTATAEFTGEAGTPADPTTVTLTIQKPDATQLVYGWPDAGADGLLTREMTGRFYRDVDGDLDGAWYWRLAGTDPAQAADEGVFYVQRTEVDG